MTTKNRPWPDKNPRTPAVIVLVSLIIATPLATAKHHADSLTFAVERMRIQSVDSHLGNVSAFYRKTNQHIWYALAELQLRVPSQFVAAQNRNKPTERKESPVTKHARGTFEVKLIPQVDEKIGDASIGRMSIDKLFQGPLEATSKGQMLAASTDVEGSAGYVAMERVNGTLEGLRGTFVFQHSGTMTRGAPDLVVTVVPDSGTGQLVGLTGKMSINIVDGKHLYDFEYVLPKP